MQSKLMFRPCALALAVFTLALAGVTGLAFAATDRADAAPPARPGSLKVEPGPKGPTLSWSVPVGGRPAVAYRIERSATDSGPWKRVGSVSCGKGACHLRFTDHRTGLGQAFFYQVTAVGSDGSTSPPNLGYARPWTNLFARGRTRTYSGTHLSGIEFPVGGIGANGIVHFGDGRRNESWIFNTYGKQRPRYQSMVPNSFFAVRAQAAGSDPVVRALQSEPVGSFDPVDSVSFTGEYPLARYRFSDSALPVEATESVYSPMIPGDLKNSAIPTAIYTFTLHNPSNKTVQASILASQQNAVGFKYEDEVVGPDSRDYAGYGQNHNQVESLGDRTRLEMTGDNGSMALSMAGTASTGDASWDTIGQLQQDFAQDGTISGDSDASSPSDGVTVDGALTQDVTLAPGETKEVRAVLSWTFPVAGRIYGGQGMKYSTWWADANAVDDYVASNRDSLQARTFRYHDTFYESNLPQYLLDRITGNTATMHTPTMFWAANDFFGGWEGWGCCWNMPTHVWHYAQSQARLWPEIGRKFESQWFTSMQPDGLIPYRFNTPQFAIDGQLGVILAAYRDHLSSPDDAWLAANWANVKSALDYVIAHNDSDHDGVLQGKALTTLDLPQGVNNPWLGGLYLASLNAASHMARLQSDTADAEQYSSLYGSGRKLQAAAFWTGDHFSPKPDPDPTVRSMAGSVDIDMLLGQWWSSQLGLGNLFPTGRTSKAMGSLFSHNFRESFVGPSPTEDYVSTTIERIFVEPTDAGLLADTFPDGGSPDTLYGDEVWPGREYSAAATMIGQGHVRDGLRVVKAVSDRYDGRIRNAPYLNKGNNVFLETCGIGDGSGNPFGDDECGRWYGRSLSSWSLLLALQGFSYDGPAGAIGFAPTFKPADHRSFYTAGDAWGLFRQWRRRGRQVDVIGVAHAGLKLNRVDLKRVWKPRVRAVEVTVGGKAVQGARLKRTDSSLRVELHRPLLLKAGQRLRIVFRSAGKHRR